MSERGIDKLIRRALAVAIICVFFNACSGKYKNRINFNPTEPLRVAVLPFIIKDSRGRIIQKEGRLLLDNFGLISSAVEETPAQIVRKQVITELKKSSLDLVSSTLIDIDLPHHGYAKPDGTLDLERLWQVPASEICSSFLSCDAVLYGTINKWERSYYGIESVNKVAIELKLVSAQPGEVVLYQASGEDSESRGITKIPTGFSSVFIEPIIGLDSEIISRLSNSIVRKILAPLVVANRPVFIDSSPPAIYASSHDGANRKISKEQPLIVVLFGSEGAQSSFSIGSSIESVPMVERSPGHYYGEYVPLQTDKFKDQKVSVSIVDLAGRKSVSNTPGGLISYP